MGASAPIPELSVVRLREPVAGRAAGTEGTVVHVHQGGLGYMVEFSNPSSVETVEHHQIELVTAG